ncbi:MULTISPECIES: hypothetical protein [unclassified Microbacterium]|uniref:DUF7144 family membrane protein n=1 Tax=unclassified Microbacterium TaxID=2609290 RepID=UPI0012FB922F|nr:hypothetical protein [Microbacterium sp. MAH-37]MVQ41535.1 hypothetical protein [Microbacterium sp. MAH-37]
MSNQKSSAWTGWAAFGAVIILVGGVFGLIQGVALLLGPEAYWGVSDGTLFIVNAASWGWWNIIVGALFLVTAIALFSGAMWARVVAIILASLNIVGQLLVINAHPWGAIVVIALDVVVIYALTAHGDEFGSRRAS